MKSLIFAVAGLIVAIVVVFLFASNYKSANDTIIPSPVPVESPKVNLNLPESSISSAAAPFPIMAKGEINGKKVKLATQKGDITIELSADAPIASSSFIYLVGKGFYDGLTFHRVEKGFVVQGGDPSGNGTGGPGYSFADEPVTSGYVRGTVAMANAGPNTNGSQFFIVLKDTPNLPKKYTLFGQVTSGMDVVDKIEVGDKINKAIIL